MQALIRLLRAAVVAVATLLLGGCFETLTMVEFRADGTVRQTIRYGMDEDAERRFTNALRAAPVPGRTSFTAESVFSEKAVRAELKRCKAELESFATERGEDGLRRADLVAKFPNHDSLRRSPLLGTRAEWFFLKGDGDQVRLVIYPLGREAWTRGRIAGARLDHTPDPLRTRKFEAMRDKLERVKIKFAVTVPGQIVAIHPAIRVSADRRGCVDEFDAKKLETAADLERALGPRYEIRFVPDGELEGYEILDSLPR
jgi:hypothetical protein